MKKFKIPTPLVIIIIGVLVGGGLYVYSTYISNPQVPSMEKKEDQGPVAIVNGEELKKDEFDIQMERIKLSYAQQGADTTNPEFISQLESQIIEQLVANALILQEAEKINLTIDDGEVDTEINNIITNLGGEEIFEEELSKSNMTRDSLQKEIHTQLLVVKYLDEQVFNELPEVTDEELQTFYDEISAEQEGVPPLEEISDMLKDQLSQQQKGLLFQGFVEELKTNSDIQILL